MLFFAYGFASESDSVPAASQPGWILHFRRAAASVVGGAGEALGVSVVHRRACLSACLDAFHLASSGYPPCCLENYIRAIIKIVKCTIFTRLFDEPPESFGLDSLKSAFQFAILIFEELVSIRHVSELSFQSHHFCLLAISRRLSWFAVLQFFTQLAVNNVVVWFPVKRNLVFSKVVNPCG